jgi:hypothetical protein
MSTDRGEQIARAWENGEQAPPAPLTATQHELQMIQAAEAVVTAAVEFHTVEHDPESGHNARAGYWSLFIEVLDHYADLRELGE